MASVTMRPTSDQDIGNWTGDSEETTNLYSFIDDSTTTEYVKVLGTTTDETAIFKFSTSGIPNGSVISNVRTVFRRRINSDKHDYDLQSAFLSGSTVTNSGTIFNIDSESWSTSYADFTNNPSTSSAWTINNINAFYGGFTTTSSSTIGVPLIGYYYIIVTYTTPLIIRPTSDYSKTDWVNSSSGTTNLYSYVDEVVSSTTDYLATDDEDAVIQFGMGSTGLETYDEINSIEIFLTGTTSDVKVDWTAEYSVHIGSTDYTGGSMSMLWGLQRSTEIENSPATSNAWTVSEIEAAKFGFKVSSDDPDEAACKLYQMFVAIDWTPGTPPSDTGFFNIF